MAKAKTIIYWVSTLWLSIGMVSTGITQVLGLKAEQDFITHLGYPAYSLVLLGTWKMLGVIAILMPRFPIVKEWAYAGFFFTTSGALFSHLAHADGARDIFPGLLLLLLTLVSYYTRPGNRRLIIANNTIHTV